MQGSIRQIVYAKGNDDDRFPFGTGGAMKIDVFSNNLDPTDAMREYASKRLRTAIDHLEHHVELAVVRLTDVNGPRGGQDMLCKVHLHLDPSGEVVLSAQGADPYEAVDDACNRLKKTLRREIERRCERRGTKNGRGPN
ncbi:MAG: hypothetical protein Tsb0013_11310 [Phycisphaerales bacterium]